MSNRNERHNYWKKDSSGGDGRLKEDKDEYDYDYYDRGGGGGTGGNDTRDNTSYTFKSTSKSHHKNPYDDLDNQSVSQLRDLKRKNKMTNADLMTEDELNTISSILKSSATKARKNEQYSTSSLSSFNNKWNDEGGGGGEDDDDYYFNSASGSGKKKKNNQYDNDDDSDDEYMKKRKEKELNEWKMKELTMIRQFLSFNINSTKKVRALHIDMKQGSTEEKLLNEIDIFNNVTELLMAPLTLKIRMKQVKYGLKTPFQLKKEKKQVDLKKSKQDLQDHLVLSYFSNNHLVLYDLVFLFELHTNSLLKKIIVHSENGKTYDTVLCSFEWDDESLFVFVIAFKMEITYKPSSSSTLPTIYLYRKDLFNENDNNDDADDFYENYEFFFHSVSSNQTNTVTLYNGRVIKADLLMNIIYSYISYLHYGYASASLFQ